MAMVNMKVVISKEAQDELMNHIICSQRRRTQKDLKELWEKKCTVAFGKYNGKGRNAWAIGIKAMKNEIFRGEGNDKPTLKKLVEDSKNLHESCHRRTEPEPVETLSDASRDDAMGPSTLVCIQDTKPLRLTYTCKVCGDEANAHRKGFNLHDLGLSVMCYSCKKLRRSKDWMCECGSIWFSCRKHKLAAEKAKKIKEEEKDRKEAAKAGKQKISEDRKRGYEAEEGNEEERVSKKRRETKQMVNFTKSECKNVTKGGLKESLLSEGLRRRFSHLM